jgi:hypothetical protein
MGAMTSVDPGEAAAHRRIEATLDHARHVDLSRVIVGDAGPEVEHARWKATSAAAAAGRSALADEARRAAREWVLQAFAQRGYSGTWAATDVAVSVARPADRAAVAEALADAVTASALEDLVDADTVDALRSRWEVLDVSSSIPEPGVLSGLTASLTQSPTRPGWRRLGSAAVVFLLGLLYLGSASPLGLVLIAAAAVVLASALRGRPD